MRITESRLRSYVRQILHEQVFGAQAFVYHGSELDPADFVKIIESNTFDPGKGAGAMYGRGLYTIYDVDRKSNTFSGEYGQFTYKLKVNLNGYLILDPDACQKVYGKNLSLKEQLMRNGQAGLYKRILEVGTAKKWQTDVSFREPDMWQNTTVEDMLNEPNLYRLFEHTSKLALPLSKLVQGSVPGMVFTGETDGKVCLIYDPSTVVVTGYYDVSVGKKFFPIAPGKEQIHRSATSQPDPKRYETKPPPATTAAVSEVINSSGKQIDRKALAAMDLKTYFHPITDEELKFAGPMEEIIWKMTVKDFFNDANSKKVFGSEYLADEEVDAITDKAWNVAKRMAKK